MKRTLIVLAMPVTLAASVAACNSKDDGGDQNEGGQGGAEETGGDGGGAVSGGKGGQASGSGGSAGQGGQAGKGQGGMAGMGTSAGGTAGSAGASAVDAGADAAAMPAKSNYECTTFLGPNVTGEWFAAGFETLVNGDKWQVKAPHRSFVEYWADPNHAVWKETCQGDFYDCQTKSKCAGGKTPDRVIFVTQTGNYLGTTQQAWQTLINSAIPTIKAKFPNVKNIELMTFVRGPGNKDCGNETTVSPNLDKAQKALADASNGFITVSPRFEVSACSMFSGQPHLSGEGNKAVAQTIGKHYAAMEKAGM